MVCGLSIFLYETFKMADKHQIADCCLYQRATKYLSNRWWASEQAIPITEKLRPTIVVVANFCCLWCGNKLAKLNLKNCNIISSFFAASIFKTSLWPKRERERERERETERQRAHQKSESKTRIDQTLIKSLSDGFVCAHFYTDRLDFFLSKDEPTQYIGR